MQPRRVPARTSAGPIVGAPPDLLADNVEAYIAGDRRRALASGLPMPDRVSGSAIFADISGFTPLTEALAAELGPQRGAEELTAVLDAVFDAVLGQLHLYGGSVIYFSGDAVTCWLDGDDGLLAAACGLAMQQAMAGVGTITTPGGSTVKLGMKVAVATGRARRFVVGDPDIQLIDVLAGALMDRLAAAEHHAERGEVVLDAATLEALAGRVEVALVRGRGPDRVGVVGALAGPAPTPPPPASYPRLPRSVVRQWLLPPVYERISAGRGEFLSELRPAVPMFVRFGGIDYDEDPDAHLLLDHFIRQAQQVIDGYGGNLLQLTIGDKGAYVHAVFGAPLAHEDDAARACAAAIDVLALEAGTAASGLQVGLSQGRLRSGAYGHRHRRAFSCLGDAVNLAARLMSAAPAGQVYVTEAVARDAGGSFSFEKLADLSVKGKAAPVAARRLTGRSRGAEYRQRRAVHPLVGRAAELGTLLELADRARAGHGQVVGIAAEAGMGKSRLVEEVVRQLGEQGWPTYTGAAASVGSAISYLAWQGIWPALLGVAVDGDPVPALERALTAADTGLLGRLPLLGAVLGTTIDDNDLTRAFDAKLRKTSLESLLLRLLSLRAEQEPLVLLLEDCHWMDPLSVDLLEVLARAVATLPVLVLLTYRPGPFAAPGLPYTTVVELDRLDPASCRELVVARLADLYGPETLAPERLLRRLTDRAEGNPFYLEELVNYLHAEGADLSDSRAVASVELPVSLATLVLSRIDTLAEPPRRTLKVASVVGREFGVGVLTGAYPDLGGARQVTGHLRRLCAYDLVVNEAPAADGYAFKHAVIREVAYDSLPFALRAVLHGRVGSWLELTDPGALDLLAHHFWHSTDEDKKRHYLLRAGEAAQARFANDAAVDYFRRVVPLLAEDVRGPVLLKLGAVLELRGDWAEAEAVFGDALELAERRGDALGMARARAARAEPVRKQGRFDAAVAELDLAGRSFEAAGDAAGLGRVAHLRGTIAAQRGDYPEARAQYERSLGIRRALGDGAAEASLLSNLAIVAEYEEDYDRAQELNEQALDLRARLDDRWGIGVSRNNLGMIAYLRHDYAASRAHLEEALRTELEVGDMWMVAMARHNLGNTTRELGDVAATCRNYSEALATFALTGDKWAQCILFEDVAMFAASADPGAALRLVGAAEALRGAIGSPRVAAAQAQLDERLRPARELLGPEAGAQHAAGLGLGPDGAQQLALQLCRAGPER
jgi:class 3 adenylate cyclase/tetratricopeptide (TPR) repeat protein